MTTTSGPAALVLQRGLQLGAMGVAAPLAINLAAIGEAAASTTPTTRRWSASSCTAATTTPTRVVPYDRG